MLKNRPITLASLLTAAWLLSTGAVAGADTEAGPAVATGSAKKPGQKRTARGRAAEKAAPTVADAGGESTSPEGARASTQAEDGVKTYEFDAVEVEGRMKAPQVIYFLRRVRKEFRAGMLGHRSFLLELSDTRRHRALR